MTTYFGIDVGNYDTKSQNTTIPSGYDGPFASKPMMANHVLEFDGKFYNPTEKRLFYLQDKTSDGRAIILTLFSLANEIISGLSKDNATRDQIQSNINKITDIVLGVGLPVSHYKKATIESLIAYYRKYMENGIVFSYDDYQFNFVLKGISVYPQGGAAAMCKQNKIAKTFSTYYVCDIGGYTVDVAQFKNGVPCKDTFSLEMGIITLYDKIVDNVLKDQNVHVDHDIIASVLNGEATILKEDTLSLIKEMAFKHANDILNSLRQHGVMFDSYPVLFVGGGSILLRPYLLKNPMIKKEAVYFINDTRANAKGYKRMVRAEYDS